MKHLIFSRSLTFYLLGLTAATLVACSDDEDAGGGIPSLPEQGIVRPVTGIHTSRDVWQYDVASYEYDAEGRMTGGTDFTGDFQIHFSPLSFTINSSSARPNVMEDVVTDSHGFITSATMPGYPTQGVTTVLRFRYNGEGRMSRMEYIERYEDGEASDTRTFHYDNGRLMRATYEAGDRSYMIREKYDYEYAAAGLYPNTGIFFFEADFLGYLKPRFLWYGGYLGLPSAELPVSSHWSSSFTEDGEESGTTMERRCTYSVTYDADGMVRTFRSSGDYAETLTFTYGESFATDVAPTASAVRPAAADAQPRVPLTLRERIRARRAAAQR